MQSCLSALYKCTLYTSQPTQPNNLYNWLRSGAAKQQASNLLMANAFSGSLCYVQCSECIHLQIYTWRGRISVTAGEDASIASSKYSNQNIVKHGLHVCSAGDHEQREVTRDWCRVSGAGRRGIYPVSHKLSRHCHAVSRYVTLHSLLSAAVSAV